MRYNGVFLADVVGLGKTIVASIIAKKFVFEKENGTNLTVTCFIKDKDNFKLTHKGDL